MNSMEHFNQLESEEEPDEHDDETESLDPTFDPPNNTTTGDSKSSSSATALVIAASDKAGMEGIDRGRIDAIILRESGNSAFMQQQRKKDRAVNDKIASLKEKLDQQEINDPHWKIRLEALLESEMQSLLVKGRTPFSTQVVVDLDMFYMACELLTRPHLREVPAVVGNSMILTSNYKARRFGVRSAMAGWIGDKLVEELSQGQQKLVHVPAHFDLYTAKSRIVRQVLSEYDPHLRAYSLDEAYLELGPYLCQRLVHPEWTHEQIQKSLAVESNQDEDGEQAVLVEDDDDDQEDAIKGEALRGGNNEHVNDILSQFSAAVVLETATAVVSQMRAQVEQATGGLTCSAGLASNFTLAKIASDHHKPNGQCVVKPSHPDVLTFLHPLAIRKIPGVGRVTEKQLHAFSITTVRDLYEQRALVRFLFQPATARFLLRASLGLSSSTESTSHTSPGQKGISRERTFSSGKPWREIMTRLEDIARLLSSDMVRKKLKAHTLTVKVKLHTFDVLSKSKTLARGVTLQDADDIFRWATQLLGEVKAQHTAKCKTDLFSIRLLGIRCSNFLENEQGAQRHMEQFLVKGGGEKTRSPSPKPLSKGSPKNTSPPRENSLGFVKRTQDFVPRQAQQPEETVEGSSVEVSDVKAAAPDSAQCPMCGQTISPDNENEGYNDVVNRHIDACLNASIVRQAVREESAAATERQVRAKRPRLTDFFRAS